MKTNPSVKRAAAKSKSISFKERQKTDKELRQAVKALPGFPDLKVGGWMPTLMQMYGLDEPPKAKDHLYRVAHDCCKGAKTRRRQK